MKKKSSAGVHIKISFGCSETEEPKHTEKAWELKDQVKEYEQKCWEETGGRVAFDKPQFLGRAWQRRFYTDRTKPKDPKMLGAPRDRMRWEPLSKPKGCLSPESRGMGHGSSAELTR